ncbi:hypothetical protein CJU90_4019 [Yarrowia sp. C11]|nr:hypothetical protein CKK34_5630 [Yarrowia sp. E02]KAG5367713.1 hypothetical protein CJU90_4019 [Yarrowia sp. C11]
MAGHHANYKWNGPLPRPHVSAGHRIATKFLGATMFFWMFLRIKEEYPAMLGLHNFYPPKEGEKAVEH